MTDTFASQFLSQVPEELIVMWTDSEEIKDPFLSCVVCLWSSSADAAARAMLGSAMLGLAGGL